MKILVEKSQKVTTIIINRPEVKNAVDAETASLLAEAFRDFEADNSAKVAILSGSDGNFCAGADLKAIAASENHNRLQADGDGPMGPTRMLLNKPVIAAVSGYAVAGGMELALWCDLRVVEKSAIFGIFNRRWGIPLIDGGTVRLPRIIGMGRALDLILTGRPVAADEALAIGLANRVVEDGSSREEAEKLALQIAEFPEVCTLQDRLSLYEQAAMGLTEAMENEFKHGLKTIEETNIFKSASLFVEGKGRHGSFSNNL